METAPPTHLSSPSIPKLALPPLSVDCHCHIYGPAARFPFLEDGKPRPADAGKEALFALHNHLGIGRSVIVQSARHGFDNAAVEDAILDGNGRYLGVALLPVDVDQAELERLADLGFRGVRFNFMRHLNQGAPIESVIALTPRLARLDMHLQVHFESDLVHELAPHLRNSAVPVVIDHMGRVDARLGPDHADFQGLCELLRDDRFLVKVSGVDRIDRAWPYARGVELARILVNEFPERCLWGTDWPHPNHHHVPDDGSLVDLLSTIAPTPALLERLMVRNPGRFYRFPQ
jgi:2-pyrone-4,6-dicarboxylate lactonase